MSNHTIKILKCNHLITACNYDTDYLCDPNNPVYIQQTISNLPQLGHFQTALLPAPQSNESRMGKAIRDILFKGTKMILQLLLGGKKKGFEQWEHSFIALWVKSTSGQRASAKLMHQPRPTETEGVSGN